MVKFKLSNNHPAKAIVASFVLVVSFDKAPTASTFKPCYYTLVERLDDTAKSKKHFVSRKKKREETVFFAFVFRFLSILLITVPIWAGVYL